MTFTQEIEQHNKLIKVLKTENRLLGERCNQLLKDKGYLTDKVIEIEQENAELKQQIEKMKCCSNCKHFNNVDDLEYCQNCERHLVNSLDKLLREEIIKDEWELKE